jgi:hypothetical protein
MNNPGNFSLDEKLEILGLTENELTKENVNKKIDEAMDKYKSSTNFFIFLREALFEEIKSKNELVGDLKTNLNRIKTDMEAEDLTKLTENNLEAAVEKMTKEELIEMMANSERNELLDDKMFAIAQKRSKYTKNIIPGIPQGELNQTRREYFIRNISFDSKYRKIPPINSIICAENINTQTESELEEELKINIANLREPSTDYTIQINVPISNVVELTLSHVEIPASWYIFDSDYGTDYFAWSYKNGKNRNWQIFDIPKGSYDENELIDTLNTRAKELGVSLKFIYTRSTHKITVENTHDTSSILIDWASGMNTPTNCFGNSKGQKVDSSMGWLMGFRSRITEISPGTNKIGSGLMDLEGPKYFLLILDDFVNNKPNQDLITMIGAEKDTSFKLPSYWNDQTMGDECATITYPDPLNRRPCGNKVVNRDLSSNLTKNQKYTVEQIKLKMNSEEINTYKAPASSDVLARISIPNDRTNRYGRRIYLNSNFDYTKRVYFGPVTISKFRIRLLNDRGHIVNLNNMDWSFSLLVKQRYQHT